jgi:ribosomal protein S27AE
MISKPSQRVTRGKVSCAACGSKFVPARHDNRYCSGACRQRAHRARAGLEDIDRRIDEAKALYWSLVAEKAEAIGRSMSQVVTDEAQFVDAAGHVFVRGEFVGEQRPHRPGWAAWGLEVASAPFVPPTLDVDVAVRPELYRGRKRRTA